MVVDPKTERVVDRVKVPDNPREVSAGEGAVWLTSADAASVTAIDPESREVAGSVEVQRQARTGSGWARAGPGRRAWTRAC